MRARVLINGKWRTHERITGVQRYAYGLTDALVEAGAGFDLAAPEAGPAWKTSLWEQRTLPRLAAGYDCLLCPANMGPYRLAGPTRLVLVLHCLRFRHHPESYARGFVRWYGHSIPRLIERADAVITVSNTTRAEIERAYPASVGKITAVYPGVDSAFAPDGNEETGPGGGDRWVFIGNGTPAKNLRVVLGAMERLPADHRLLLVGVDERERDVICPPGLVGRVDAAGSVSDAGRIASILRGARGLLAPSRYESFDLPTAEAMASGCPVIASDLPVHREICGPAGEFVPGDDPGAWAEAMGRVGGGGDLRAEMRRRGLARAEDFSWERAADEVMGVVERCVGAVGV